MDLTIHLIHNVAVGPEIPLFNIKIILPCVVLQVSKPQYDKFTALGENANAFLKDMQEMYFAYFYLNQI